MRIGSHSRPTAENDEPPPLRNVTVPDNQLDIAWLLVITHVTKGRKTIPPIITLALCEMSPMTKSGGYKAAVNALHAGCFQFLVIFLNT